MCVYGCNGHFRLSIFCKAIAPRPCCPPLSTEKTCVLLWHHPSHPFLRTASHSTTSELPFPLGEAQLASRRWRQDTWSRAFDLTSGFCSISAGKVVAAFKAKALMQILLQKPQRSSATNACHYSSRWNLE